MKKITTLRLSEDRMRLIRAIAGYEDRTLTEIFTELADEYIERHTETLELLNIPGFAAECHEGLNEIISGGGKDIDDLLN